MHPKLEKHGLGCITPPMSQTPARLARQKSQNEAILVVKHQGHVFRSLSFGGHQRSRNRNSTGWPPVGTGEVWRKRLAGISAKPQWRAPFWQVGTAGPLAVQSALGCQGGP